jgi:hypothetical protein
VTLQFGPYSGSQTGAQSRLNGKSGYGRVENDPEFAKLEKDLTPLQRTLESITFYKSIAFIRKKELVNPGPK